jgi:hypothetical protein
MLYGTSSATNVASSMKRPIRISDVRSHHGKVFQLLKRHRALDAFISGRRLGCRRDVPWVRLNQPKLIRPHENGAALLHVAVRLLALNVARTIPRGVYNPHVWRQLPLRLSASGTSPGGLLRCRPGGRETNQAAPPPVEMFCFPLRNASRSTIAYRTREVLPVPSFVNLGPFPVTAHFPNVSAERPVYSAASCRVRCVLGGIYLLMPSKWYACRRLYTALCTAYPKDPRHRQWRIPRPGNCRQT